MMIFSNALCGSAEDIEASTASRSTPRASTLMLSDFNLSASDTFLSFVIESMLSVIIFNRSFKLVKSTACFSLFSNSSTAYLSISFFAFCIRDCYMILLPNLVVSLAMTWHHCYYIFIEKGRGRILECFEKFMS
jgi:hypothetical protein